MAKLILTFFFLSVLAVVSLAQPPIAPTQEAREQLQREAAQRRVAEQTSGGLRLRELNRRRLLSAPAFANIKGLYREPTRKELKKLRPFEADLRTYAVFLKGRGTGITRLEPYSGCGDETKVVSASQDCLEYSMPGNGSDFSFRERNYRLGRLADLRFSGDGFSSPGVLQHGVLVGLGDVPLEQVRLTTAGVAYIRDLQPSRHFKEAIDFEEKYRAGVERDGYYYASSIRALDDKTYVLRSIAYRGNVVRSIGGVVFNEIELDERADVVVAFRIVRRHDSGGITILWKELDRAKSPELKRPSVEPAKSLPSQFVAKQPGS